MPSTSADPREAASEAGRAPAGAGSRRRRRWILVAVLVLVPVLVRGLLLEAYAIRSDSMSPAFEPGDLLLVLQPTLDTREPRRWDVALVDRSVDSGVGEGVEAILKRVAGLPGEWVELRGGDLWVAPADRPGELSLARKPDELIESLLVVVHDARGLAAPWVVPPGTRAPVPPDAPATVLRAAPGESVTAVFDAIVDDGRPGEPGEEAVGDTALRVEVGAVDATLTLVLQEGASVFRARLPKAGSGEAASLHHNLERDDPRGVVDRARGFAGLRPGDTVLAWNADDGVRVLVNGRAILRHDGSGRRPGAPPEPGTTVRNSPALQVESGVIELQRVAVLRDVHYSRRGLYGVDPAAGVTPCRVPPDALFVLGDNSRRSRDSRDFGPVPREAVRGRPLAILRPWSRAAWLDAAGAGRRGPPAGPGRP